MQEDLPPAIPAATLILMRPAADGGAPDILFIERARTMAFAAGALVFPGGRIDPEDHEAAARLAPGLDDGAARIAAVRETIEETGIAPLLPPSADAAALRRGLTAGEPFGALLARFHPLVDLAELTPFARWLPNFREARRFDTLFYLAEAPAGAPEPLADRAEAVSSFWASAAKVLADLEAGRAHAIFPTRRNLERLARFGSIDEARADAAAHPVETITPWVEERAGRRFVCIPEGIGYPVTAEPYESARRR
ncbi:MAG TPA: NUDIX hydrolase [Allosphingosinicella sp.]|nr:NUDIX hydrolase [Allosphingosinicella sp.]